MLTAARKWLLSSLDQGSDTVSVYYEGGHGSKQSVCLSAVTFVGFLVFLVLFGVLQLGTTTTIQSLVNSGTINYAFASGEMVFALDQKE